MQDEEPKSAYELAMERLNQQAPSVKLTAEQKAKNPDRVHPVIRTHPHTGRKCIYVDETYTDHIVGVPPDASRALLAELHEHCIQPRFYYRHRWQARDLVVWDNCATQHKSTFDYALPQRRVRVAADHGDVQLEVVVDGARVEVEAAVGVSGAALDAQIPAGPVCDGRAIRR